KDALQSDAMSILIVTKGRGKIKLKQSVDIQENSMICLSLNSINEVLLEGQSFSISGVSFTSDFIERTEVMIKVIPYIFSFFSAGSFLVWQLESEEAVMVEQQIRLL